MLNDFSRELTRTVAEAPNHTVEFGRNGFKLSNSAHSLARTARRPAAGGLARRLRRNTLSVARARIPPDPARSLQNDASIEARRRCDRSIRKSGGAMLWSTWLQRENGPALSVRHHILILYKREVTVSAVVLFIRADTAGDHLAFKFKGQVSAKSRRPLWERGPAGLGPRTRTSRTWSTYDERVETVRRVFDVTRLTPRPSKLRSNRSPTTRALLWTCGICIPETCTLTKQSVPRASKNRTRLSATPMLTVSGEMYWALATGQGAAASAAGPARAPPSYRLLETLIA
ncbi:hypothetical protein EVAR_2804_1 [Eumeta japonica]|uniref:Uncharacterized protein n=1 Tax=Eumeta variegata TaxID=151549 RepID=A0A4C1T0P1_EUMVA|nr:hypothetical protein EVAR_2804_1 [Eumeta japonica]